LISTGGNSFNSFISKYDASGNFIWAKVINGANEIYIDDMKLDANGNIFITGSFSGTVDFDLGPVTFNLTSIGFNDPTSWLLTPCHPHKIFPAILT
jgi:hypothetical protein